MPVFDSLALALAYLDRHFYTRYIFPIKAGAKFPPLVQDNLASNASNDPEQIRKWAKKWPGCNWGVAHRKSTLLVVDVDCNQTKGKVGQQTFDALALAYDWPETERTETPSGGFHLVYEGEHIMALGENGIGKDIDSPNYTLIAGCTFTDGTSYVGNDAPSIACPSWIYDVIKNAKSKARITDAADVVVDFDKPENITAAIDFLQNDAVPAIEGQGGDFNTLKAAMYLKDLAISPTLAVDLLNDYYNPRCEPPWDREGLETKVNNAYAYSSLSKVGGKTAEADFADDPPEPITPMGKKRTITQQRRERARARATEASRDGERRATVTRQSLIEAWVWIGRDERFMLRADTEVAWKKSAFDNMYRELVKKGEPKSLAETLLAQSKGTIEKYDSVGFKPGMGRTLEGGTVFNLYTPPEIEPAEGDLTWWNEHLEYLFPEPEYRNHVLNWMAWLLKNLTKKPKHALIIQGPEQGTGKSFVAGVLRKLVHEKNVSIVSQTSLSGKFNSWALRAKLVVIEELRAVDRAEVKQNLHHLITEDVIDVERKGLDIEKAETCFGIFGMTNDDAALMLDNTDRRYLVVKTDAKPRSSTYYNALYARLDDVASMAAVFFSLLNRDLGEYSGEQAAPLTSAKNEMFKAAAGDLEVFMDEHRDEFPLSGRLIMVEDVVNMLPRRLEGRSPRLYSQIKAILRREFQGEDLGQRRLPSTGLRARMIAINGSAGILRNQLDNCGAIYEADQKAKGKGTDLDDATGEFGVDNGADAE